MTVLDLLRATDARTRHGLLYDLDGSSSLSSPEQTLQEMVNQVYPTIHEQGDI